MTGEAAGVTPRTRLRIARRVLGRCSAERDQHLADAVGADRGDDPAGLTDERRRGGGGVGGLVDEGVGELEREAAEDHATTQSDHDGEQGGKVDARGGEPSEQSERGEECPDDGARDEVEVGDETVDHVVEQQRRQQQDRPDDADDDEHDQIMPSPGGATTRFDVSPELPAVMDPK